MVMTVRICHTVCHKYQVLPYRNGLALWCWSWEQIRHTHHTGKTWTRSQESASLLSYYYLCMVSQKSLAFSTSQTSLLQSEGTEINTCEGTLPTVPRLENIKAPREHF